MTPKLLTDFIGQDRIKDDLRIILAYVRQSKAILGHCAMLGPPGYGKTTLAGIISNELDYFMYKIVGGSFNEEKFEVMLNVINLSKKPVVIFIDEIHAIQRKYFEYLYSPMEEFRHNDIELNPFCLIGASTDFGLLPKPLRDRFQNEFIFKTYELNHIEQILLNNGCPQEIAQFLAKRSRLTPRVTLKLFKRILIEWKVLNHENSIPLNLDICKLVFDRYNIDEYGLNETDREIISYMYANKASEMALRPRPVGLDALCAALNISKPDYSSIFEPFLIQSGFISRTPRGRIVTRLGIDKILKIKEPKLFTNKDDLKEFLGE